MRAFRFVLLLLTLTSVLCPLTSLLALTWQTDGSAANVQFTHDILAVDGDTITIPSGTFNWTAGVNITKKIATIGNTTTNAPISGVCNDLTIIIDNVSRAANKPVFNLVGGDQRVSGIKFQAGLTTPLFAGGINLVGSYGHPSRVDHCHFDHAWFAPLINSTDCFGVVDHNVCNYDASGGGQNEPGFVHSFCPNYGGKTRADGVWEVPAGIGGPEFTFIEDNYVDSGGTYACGTNNFDGGKTCFRHNKYVNSVASPSNHGLSRHNSDMRGGRALEFYNNEFHWALAWYGMDGTDGETLAAHDNTWDGNTTWFSYNYYRGFYNLGPTFGGADGRNAWDYNCTEADGVTHIDGHPPYLFQSGSFTSIQDSQHMTDSTKNWTTNQWAGYSVRRTSDGMSGWIESNTNTTLMIYGFIPIAWNVGDHYEIHKLLRGMDQPGLGTCPPIDRANPAWPNQASEPSYVWNNVFTPTGQPVVFLNDPAAPYVRMGVDVVNGPMPGYTPYIYPHPLVSGAPTPSPTPTPSPSISPTPTPTATPLPTPSPSPTPSATPTVTPTPTSTPSPSPTPSASPTPSSSPTPTPTPTATPTPTPERILLTASGMRQGGRVMLNWTPSLVLADIYRDGNLVAQVANSAIYIDHPHPNGRYTYQACDDLTGVCSNYAFVVN